MEQQVRYRENFDLGWRFALGDPEACCPKFDDSAWRAGLADAADLRATPVTSWDCVRLFVALRVLTYAFSFMLVNWEPVMIWKASR